MAVCPKTCEITANPMSQTQSTATGGSSLSPPSGTKVTNARLLRTELASASAEALIRSRARRNGNQVSGVKGRGDQCEGISQELLSPNPERSAAQ
jgi:hypothetical protein